MAIGERIKNKKQKEFSDNSAFWQSASDFVDGSESTVINSKYIQRYSTEKSVAAQEKTLFEDRLLRSYNFNITEPIVLQHQSACAQKITIKGFESEQGQLILEDVTGYGDSAQDAFIARLWEYFKQGFVVALVESPAVVAENADGARQAGERSYQVNIEALSVLRLTLFHTGPSKGKVQEFMYYTMPEVDGDDIFITAKRYYQAEALKPYVVQTLRAETAMNAKSLKEPESLVVVDEVEVSSLPFLPVVPIGCGPADSSIKDVWPLNKALINKLSVYSSTNYHQQYQRVVFGNVPDGAVIEGLSECSAVSFRDDVSVNTIEPSQPVSAENEIKMLMRLAQQFGLLKYNEMMEDTRAVQSAESKAKDLRNREAYYLQLLDMFEKKELQIYNLHAAYEGIKDQIEVTLARDLKLTDSELELVKDAQLFERAGSFDEATALEIKKSIMKRDISEMQIDAEERKRLLDIIEAATLYKVSFSAVTGKPSVASLFSADAQEDNTSAA